MKIFKQSIIAVILCVFAPVGLKADVKNGELAPVFQLLDAHEKEHSLDDYRGKYVVLEWTNHQCPFVVKFYSKGNMQAWQKEFTDKDVVWLSIVSSAEGKSGYLTHDEAKSLAKSQGEQATAKLLDPSGNVGKLYGARTTPHMFIIDPDGKVVYQGAIDSIKSTNPEDVNKAENYVVNALNAVLANESITTAKTRPYGCGVKY